MKTVISAQRKGRKGKRKQYGMMDVSISNVDYHDRRAGRKYY